jgi:hypothetical protein
MAPALLSQGVGGYMSGRFSRHIFWLLTAVVAATGLGAAAHAQDELDLRPWWASQLQLGDISNHSMLYYWRKRTPGDVSCRHDDIDPQLEAIAGSGDPVLQRLEQSGRDVGGMRQQYEDMNRDYEMRHVYGLTTYDLERAHAAQMSQFTQDIMNSVENNQLRQEQDRITNSETVKSLEKSDTVKALERPAIVVGVMGAAYYGKPFGFDVAPETRVTGYSNLRGQAGGFGLVTRYGSTNFDLAMQNMDTANSLGQERYRLAVAGNLPWAFSTGFRYGTSTSTLTSSLSRPLSSHLVASFNDIRPLQAVDLGYVQPQWTLRCDYGITF